MRRWERDAPPKFQQKEKHHEIATNNDKQRQTKDNRQTDKRHAARRTIKTRGRSRESERARRATRPPVHSPPRPRSQPPLFPLSKPGDSFSGGNKRRPRADACPASPANHPTTRARGPQDKETKRRRTFASGKKDRRQTTDEAINVLL